MKYWFLLNGCEHSSLYRIPAIVWKNVFMEIVGVSNVINKKITSGLNRTWSLLIYSLTSVPTASHIGSTMLNLTSIKTWKGCHADFMVIFKTDKSKCNKVLNTFVIVNTESWGRSSARKQHRQRTLGVFQSIGICSVFARVTLTRIL